MWQLGRIRPRHTLEQRLGAEIAQDLRFALRAFRRQPLAGSAVVLIIGLAIGANSAIFSVVDAIVLQPIALPRAEELAILWKAPLRGEPTSGVSPANALEMQAGLRTAAAVASVTQTSLVLRSATDGDSRVAAMRVSSGFFRTLGVSPALGRGFLPSEDVSGGEPVAVISHALWQQHFGGNPHAVGQRLAAGGEEVRVVGVMPRGFHFPALFGIASHPEVWLPLRFSSAEASARGAGYMFVLVRRQPHIGWPAVQQELETVSRQYAASEPLTYGGQHLVARPVHEQVVGRFGPILLSLWAAVSCVLVMACANVANLLLSRATVRARELAVRATLGASRARLVRQLLTESLVLGLASAALGLTLAFLLVDAAAPFIGDALPRASEVSINWRVVLFATAAAVLTNLTVGALPALQLRASAPQDALRSAALGNTPSAWSTGLRRTLVVGQIAMAVFLAMCAGLLAKSFAAVQRVDLGFEPSGLLTFAVSLPEGDYDGSRAATFYERLIDRIAQLPQSASAGAVSVLPLSGLDFSWTYEVRDKPVAPGTALDTADVRIVTPGALKTMGVALNRGRDFDRTDRKEGLPVAIVNEAFARRTWPGEDALGKEIKLAGPVSFVPWMRVVGVIANVHLDGADRQPLPAIYRPHRQHSWRGMAVVVRTAGPPEAARSDVLAAVRSLEPNAAILDVRDFTWYRTKSLRERQIVTVLMSSFATIANVLALAGIYALFAYTVAVRTREMGIRLTLGARPSQVVWLVMRHALVLCLPGLSLGLAAAVAARRVLEAHLFGVSAADVPTLAAVVAGVLCAACVASYLPARRAAAVSLTTALRLE